MVDLRDQRQQKTNEPDHRPKSDVRCAINPASHVECAFISR